jgi:hypothetical protein
MSRLQTESIPENMSAMNLTGNTNTTHEWMVFSTAVIECVLMLECAKTGAYGIVRNPTKEEWREAFYAPSDPYRWEGGDDRVESPPKPRHGYERTRKGIIAEIIRRFWVCDAKARKTGITKS